VAIFVPDMLYKLNLVKIIKLAITQQPLNVEKNEHCLDSLEF